MNCDLPYLKKYRLLYQLIGEHLNSVYDENGLTWNRRGRLWYPYFNGGTHYGFYFTRYLATVFFFPLAFWNRSQPLVYYCIHEVHSLTKFRFFKELKR